MNKVLKNFMIYFLLGNSLIAQDNIIIGLNGNVYNESSLSFGHKEKFLIELQSAKNDYVENPNDLNAIVWYGRRLAYLGRFQEAITIYSRGLEIFPENPELLRHRGHRYLTIRKIGLARRDFTLAAKKCKHLPIQVELDGRPNEQNIPLGNLHRNIYYHWALTEYIAGNFLKSASLFGKCLQYCQVLEMKISVWDWQFLSYLRGGKSDLANQVLEKVPKVTALIENDNYYQRLQFYKGELPFKQIINFSQPLTPEQINMAYGMSCLEENKEKANEIKKDILKTNQWISFSFLAAEADISRKANK